MALARILKQYITDNYPGGRFIDKSYNKYDDVYVLLYSLNSQMFMVKLSSGRYKQIIGE